MKFLLLTFLSCILTGQLFSSSLDSESYKANFEEAYLAYPIIPKGLLEGVAFA